MYKHAKYICACWEWFHIDLPHPYTSLSVGGGVAAVEKVEI